MAFFNELIDNIFMLFYPTNKRVGRKLEKLSLQAHKQRFRNSFMKFAQFNIGHSAILQLKLFYGTIFFLPLQVCLFSEEVKTSSTLDRFTKIKFGKLLLPCLGLGPLEMLENVFCSKMSPSLRTGHFRKKTHLPTLVSIDPRTKNQLCAS